MATPLVLRLVIDSVNWPPLFLATMVGGFMLPDKLINDIKKARWREILRTMPGAVDVLSLSVEAGLDFQVAMQRFVERGTPGALRDEFSTILNDMRLGKTRAEAIRDFGRRVTLPGRRLVRVGAGPGGSTRRPDRRGAAIAGGGDAGAALPAGGAGGRARVAEAAGPPGVLHLSRRC